LSALFQGGHRMSHNGDCISKKADNTITILPW